MINIISLISNPDRKAYEAIRSLNKKEQINVVVDNDVGELVTDPEQKTEIITAFFESLFSVENVAPFIGICPTKLETPFTADEISKCANKLRNNKSTGPDNLPAELIKAAPPIIHEEIAVILNLAAETGDYPKEIKKGYLLPLPKPKKPQGPCKSLRPIILLSVLRKILAVAVVQRVFDRTRESISVSQVAYSPDRGASELILTFKLLAEKAITSQNYEFHIIMLDMFRAFDTTYRASVLNKLKRNLKFR